MWKTMTNNNGGIIQGSFVGGRPRLAVAAAASSLATQARMAGAHPSEPRLPGPHTARSEATKSAHARPATAQPRAAQRVGQSEAFQLPASLANFAGQGGQPLPAPVLRKMESFFNTGFADVRVHVGTQAVS